MCRSLLSTYKMQTLNNANFCIGRSNRNIIGVETDFILAFQCSLHRNHCFRAERNCDNRLRETELVGHCQCDGMFAHNLAFIKHLNSYLTGSAV